MASVSKAPAGAGEISRPFIASPKTRNYSLPQSISRKLRFLTTIPGRPQTTSNLICVVCISDTHNTKPSLPHGDILLHAGDLSQYGLFDEIQAQLDWVNAQPHRHKIVIAGNHDLILDEVFVKSHPDRELDKVGKSRCDLRWGSVEYLQNASVEVVCNGRILNIFGSPTRPKCGNFAFQYNPDEDDWTNTIPDGTNILLTHGPPAVHFDEGKGCEHLLKEIWRARPDLLVFGHIHDGRGEEFIMFDSVQAKYENIQLGIQPWINIVILFPSIIRQWLRKTLLSGNGSVPTHLVNAAVVAGRGNLDRREPIIAYI
jgi:predicted phosphodiesterase